MSNKHEATFRLKKNNDGRFVGGKDFLIKSIQYVLKRDRCTRLKIDIINFLYFYFDCTFNIFSLI